MGFLKAFPNSLYAYLEKFTVYQLKTAQLIDIEVYLVDYDHNRHIALLILMLYWFDFEL